MIKGSSTARAFYSLPLGLRQFPLFIFSHQKQRPLEAIKRVRRIPGVIRYSRNECASYIFVKPHACGLQRALLYHRAARVLPACAQHTRAGSSLAGRIFLHIGVCAGWQRTVKFAFPETCWISD